MKKVIYTFIFIVFFMMNAKAGDSFLYQYKITFKQNPETKIDEAKEWIKKLAHTIDVEVQNAGKSFQFNTIQKINTVVFMGKFQKLNFEIEKIEIKNQSAITDEQKDKIVQQLQLTQSEIIKSGK